MPHQFPIERYLNVRAASTPSFSPDGRFIAYIINTTGIPQAWLIPTVGGEPTQLTFGADAVRGVWFSPVKHELIFSMDAGGNERTQLFRLFGVGGGTDHAIGDGWDSENLSNEPKAIHSFGGWSHDGTRIAFSANRDDASRFDIFIQTLGDKSRKTYQGPGGYFSPVGWPSTQSAVLIHRVESNNSHDLYLHYPDAEGHNTRKLSAHEGEAQYDSPRWSADGNSIYCASTAGGRDLAALAEINVASGKITWLEAPRHEVEHVEASPKGRWLAYVINEDGRSALKLRDLKSGKTINAPGLPAGVIGGLEFSRDDGQLAFTFDGPRNNGDIWLWDLNANKTRQLTHSGRAGLPFSEFIEPELIKYKTFDNRDIPAWWYPAKPQAADGPVIVYPHGGPESQTRPNFTALFQFFLARGYSILAPNVRGSSGYGTAFMNLDNTTKRMDSVADLAHAAHWIKEQKKGDPKRIAVYGGSYGGFMVLAALTHYPDLWAAGIDVVGICNWVTFLEQTGAYRRAHREKEYGNLREHRDFLVKISPLNHVDKIKCPLMVIHGANDPRVPVGEAEQIVAALKKRGIPIEYLRYEDEGHGLVKLKNRLDAYPKMAAFLDRYLNR